MCKGAKAGSVALAMGLAAALCASSAEAAQRRMYSYEPATPEARRLAGVGLTFQFRPRLLGAVRVERFMLTGRPGAAELRPASQGDLGKGGLEGLLGASQRGRGLYEIKDERDGPALIRAACPGSTKGWMVTTALRYGEDLTVSLLGDDPGKGAARVCGTYAFRFKGEWKLPESAIEVPETEPGPDF